MPQADQLIEWLETRRLFAAGDLDPTYGTAGKVTYAMPSVSGDSRVALQGGDRVLLAVTNFGDRSFTILLNRYRADGSLDTTFAGSLVIAQDPRGMQSISAIAVMPDDRIVVAGESPNGFGQILFLTPSGKIDRSRGKNGALVLPGTNPLDGTKETFTIRTMTAAPDRSLYVAGIFDSSLDCTVAKLAPNGHLDKAFGTHGEFVSHATSQLPQTDSLDPQFMMLRSDGDIIIDADELNDHGSNLVGPQFVVLSPGGQQQPFNYTNASGGSGVFALGAATLSDGSLLSLEEDGSEIRLAKYDLHGNRDPHFATQGVLDLGEEVIELPQFANALDLQPDGKVLISLDTTLTRLDATNGAIDPSFGVNGVQLNTGKLTGISSDGSIMAASIPNDGTTITFERRFADEGPVGLLTARTLTSVPAGPYKFVVQWRDDDGINAASLVSALQIIGPDGTTYKARLLGTIVQNANALFAIYKFAAPGGTWSALDDGIYTIRVRDGKVKDIHGAATTPQALGQFSVAV